VIHYLDTSALVKRYLREPGTTAVRALFRSGKPLATARIAEAELTAALARLCRMGHLTETIRDRIFARLERDLAGLTLVEIRPALVRRVPSLVTRHPLRGYDAIHLAAALLLRDQGAPVDFWASDVPLLVAARAEGLRAVVPK